MIYVLGCPHFAHANVIKYCDRPFKDLAEMHTTMINNWNEVISKEDIVIILGDLVLANKDVSMRCLSPLKGTKILIRGNHDGRCRQWYYDCGISAVIPTRMDFYFGAEVGVLTHKPLSLDEMRENEINIHAHIHEKVTGLERHVNVSVERTGYKPVELEGLIKCRKELDMQTGVE